MLEKNPAQRLTVEQIMVFNWYIIGTWMVDRIWIITLTFEWEHGIFWSYRHGDKISYNHTKCVDGTQDSCQITLYGKEG